MCGSSARAQGTGSVGRGVAGALPHHFPAESWEASALPLGLQVMWEGFPSPICQQPLGCSPQLAGDVGRSPKSGGICTQPPHPRGLAVGPVCPPPSATAQASLHGGGAALPGEGRVWWAWSQHCPCAQGALTGLYGLWFALQLLRRLESENARLEAALEWRRRELVFWQWMVRKPPDHLPWP